MLVCRVQIDWTVVRGWFRRDKGDSTETLAALRKRKAATGETLKSTRTEQTPPVVPVTHVPHLPVAPKPKPPPTPAPAPAAPTGDAGKGTLGKLLAAKKSRQNENR
ncbi:MAG: hypothetical protein U1F77_01805 [Kiritimatiellia bacterium]